MADDPCPTCGRTYGSDVGVADRCGCCLTGLSLDGFPVRPVLRGNEWVSPIHGGKVLRLPDGTWTVALSDFFGSAEEQIAAATADRSAPIDGSDDD
jgi:hypothetical protein